MFLNQSFLDNFQDKLSEYSDHSLFQLLSQTIEFKSLNIEIPLLLIILVLLLLFVFLIIFSLLGPRKQPWHVSLLSRTLVQRSTVVRDLPVFRDREVVIQEGSCIESVSYTHLTLPTICSV